MPLTERDPNVSGRNSRASNLSASSKGYQKVMVAARHDSLSAPGVMSMLKTSTELGDIGALAYNSKVPALPNQSRRRSGTGPRLSTSSNVSQGSASHRRSHHRAWPSQSSGARRSITSSITAPQYIADTLSPTVMDIAVPSSPLMPPPRSSQDRRSLSMTYASKPPHALSNNPSLASLRSQGMIPRPRSPYRYPTRLKRPGYRPASPAMSDVTGIPSRRGHPTGYTPRLRGASGAPGNAMPLGDLSRMPYSEKRNRSAPSVGVMPDQFQPPTYDNNRFTPTPVPTPSDSSTPYESFRRPSSDIDSSPPPATPHGHEPLNPGAVVACGLEEQLHMDADVAPSYYDYTEQFEGGEKTPCPILSSPAPPPTAAPLVPSGFVHRVKTILETQSSPNQPIDRPEIYRPNHDIAEHPVDTVIEEKTEVFELPGDHQPIKRITRDIIVQALHSTSEKGDSTTATVELRHPAPLPSTNVDASTDGASLSDGGIAAASSNASIIECGASEATDSTLDSFASAPDSVVDFAITSVTKIEKRDSGASASMHITQKDDTKSQDEEPVSMSVKRPYSFTVDDSIIEESMTTLPSPRGKVKARQSEKLPESLASRPDVQTEVGLSKSAPIIETKNKSSFPSVIHSNSMNEMGSKESSNCPVDSSVEATNPSIEEELPSPQQNARASSVLFPSDTSAPGNATVHMPTVLAPPGDTITARDSMTTTHLVWNYRRSYAPTSSYTLDRLPSKRMSQDSTTDLRLSSLRYPGAYLPDVKEESHEGSSLAESRPTSFRFPHPNFNGFNPSTEELSPRLFERRSVRSVPLSPSQQLLQARMIPSLNFSRMDLISKLNEALDTRPRSLDGGTTDLNYRGLLSTLERRVSSGSMRDRYKSFFASLDEFDTGTVVEEITTRHSLDIVPTSHGFTSDPLVEEITKLSIPSVNGLAQRLSELLPSFKDLVRDDGTEDTPEQSSYVEENTDGAAGQNGVHRSKTVHPERSSRRLRPIAGKPGLVVVEDAVYEKLREKSRLSLETGQTASKATEHSDDGRRAVSMTEINAPVNARFRSQSLTHLENLALPDTSKGRTHPKDVAVLADDGQPWHHENSYPWADISPAVDIHLPAPVHLRERAGPSRLRNRLSDNSASTSSDKPEVDDDSVVGPLECTRHHDRKTSKHSVLESIVRKVHISNSRIDSQRFSGDADNLGMEDRTVDPGDRYPTTGLTPPATFNIEEVRSFFSDDSSQGENDAGTFRKRLTNLKTRIPPVRRAVSAMERRSVEPALDRPVRRAFGSASCHSRFGARGDAETTGSVQTFDGTVGMSKIEFRARKVVEKLKMIWFKGGELVRSLSGRARRSTRDSGDGNSWPSSVRDSATTAVYEGT